MPHLEYPAYFDGGLLGVKCKKDIRYHEAYMCVPFKMIMSLEKAYIHPVLKKIIEENQDCFEEDFNQDFEQMTLALFIVYEMTLGKESYWYPYLRLMPDVEFTCSWSDKDMEEAQDEKLTRELKEYYYDLETEWHMFKKVLTQYPKIFSKKLIDRGLFFNIYGQVCTRCFGYGLPSCSMVPMADNMNHNCVDINVEIVNLGMQTEKKTCPDYYTSLKFMSDYTDLFENQNATNGKEYDLDSLNIKGRFNREAFAYNQRQVGTRAIAKQLDEGKQIWSIPHTLEKYVEDNDSDEEAEESKEGEGPDLTMSKRERSKIARIKQKMKNR